VSLAEEAFVRFRGLVPGATTPCLRDCSSLLGVHLLHVIMMAVSVIVHHHRRSSVADIALSRTH